MAMITDASLAWETEAEGLAFAREVLRIEAEALERVRDRLGLSIARRGGSDLPMPGERDRHRDGQGGAGRPEAGGDARLDGHAGLPAPPGEAVHGDLGRIRADDVVLALSQSGETEEVLRLIPALRRLGACLVAITERSTSSLGRAADLCIALGPIEEACPLGLAPSASTTAHDGGGRRPGPAGQPDARLPGRGLRPLSPGREPRPEAGAGRGRDADRPAAPTAPAPNETVREVFVRLAGPRRRSGAVLIVDDDDRPARASSPTATSPACSRTAARTTARPPDRRGDDAPTPSGSPSARRSARPSRR